MSAEFETEALIHLDALYRTALRLTGRREEAEEVVQDTFLKAFRFWENYQQGTNCRAWLYRILHTTFATRYQKDKRRPPTVELDEQNAWLGPEDERLGMDADSWGELLSRAVEDDVLHALEALPVPYRMVVLLSDLEGMPYKEIAQVMEVPVGTVMSRLHRGRRALREQLAGAARRYGIGPQRGREGEA
ncbi:MAG: sigma-70 family RNA polymerase sigma factor [Nitrospirota bacterium]|nr:sigma-70 family RNA polymerase sigma factor [Nitrospirota bacterium]